MNNYEKLKAAIVASCPDIMELKMGCKVTHSYNDNQPALVIIGAPYEFRSGKVINPWNLDDQGYLVEILGRDITLEDVLKTIALKDGSALVDQDGDFCKGYSYDNSPICNWQLGLPLHLQKPEVWEFLAGLLINKP